jgi:hypothetical protein
LRIIGRDEKLSVDAAAPSQAARHADLAGEVYVRQVFRRGWSLVLVTAAGLILTACGGGTIGHRTSASRAGGVIRSEPADGLRASVGYASYEGCARACLGTVPGGLLHRTLHVPRVSPGNRCPVSSARTLGSFVGAGLDAGPVYPVLGTSGVLNFHRAGPRTSQSVFADGKWGGQKVLYVAAPSYQGPVLIRGRQLDGPNAIGFGRAAVPLADMQPLQLARPRPVNPLVGESGLPTHGYARAGATPTRSMERASPR